MIPEQKTAQLPRSRTAVCLLVIGVVMVASNLRAPITAVGPLLGEIRDSLGISNPAAGVLTTLPVLAFSLLSPIVPRLARKLGLELAIWIGMVLLTLGILLRSAQGAASLFFGTLVIGLAIALGNVLVPSLVKRDFSQQIGVMTGVYTVCMNLWGGVASGLSVPLAHGLGLGWSGALGFWALFSLGAIFVWLPQLRYRQRSPLPAPGRAGRSLWRSRLAWQVTFYMGLQSTIFYVTISWLPEILQQLHGTSDSTAGWMLSLMQFIILPITFFITVLAGRSKSQQGLAVSAGLCILIGLVGVWLGSSSLVLWWVIVLGLGVGSAFSLGMMFFALRARDAQQAAELSGMGQMVGYLLAAAGPPLVGWLHDVSGDWNIPFLALIIVAALTTAFGFGAGRRGYVTTGSEPDQAG
ncbi:CynX/NimT family MFS transporter [Brevibacillus marinus]|uniref:CynX/NimT family MFS transporter n=1 Tax=Brevibacillus marinus TaxID=2496837 RepID=UPI001F497BB3|nr:MFS transporter [Brevibacillus marinus]